MLRGNHNKNIKDVVVGTVLMGVIACAPTEEANLAPELESPFPPNSYATAIDRYAPLGLVRGAEEDLAVDEARSDYAAAHDLAVETDSYALLVWRDGALRVETYFEPATSDVRQETASMHKSVLALLVAAAIDDGFIASADDEVSRYIPEWADDPRGAIRVVDLLTMSSGLAPLSPDGGADSEAARYVYDGVDARQKTLSPPLLDKPGDVFDYQNLTSQLLVIVLENATQQSYAGYLSERLWRPIGASDAYVWLNEPDGFPRGYSTLLAKARDWLRVGLLVKDRGEYGGEQVIAADLIDAATKSSATNPNYGWQIWLGAQYQPMRKYSTRSTLGVVASEPFLVDDMIYFDGFGGQRVYISREKDLVIVRLGEMTVDWDDAALPNAVIRDLP